PPLLLGMHDREVDPKAAATHLGSDVQALLSKRSGNLHLEGGVVLVDSRVVDLASERLDASLCVLEIRAQKLSSALLGSRKVDVLRTDGGDETDLVSRSGHQDV